MHQTLGLGKGTSGLSEKFKFLTNNVVTCIETKKQLTTCGTKNAEPSQDLITHTYFALL